VAPIGPRRTKIDMRTLLLRRSSWRRARATPYLPWVVVIVGDGMVVGFGTSTTFIFEIFMTFVFGDSTTAMFKERTMTCRLTCASRIIDERLAALKKALTLVASAKQSVPHLLISKVSSIRILRHFASSWPTGFTNHLIFLRCWSVSCQS
jgi:hypothetical protein